MEIILTFKAEFLRFYEGGRLEDFIESLEEGILSNEFDYSEIIKNNENWYKIPEKNFEKLASYDDILIRKLYILILITKLYHEGNLAIETIIEKSLKNIKKEEISFIRNVLYYLRKMSKEDKSPDLYIVYEDEYYDEYCEILELKVVLKRGVREKITCITGEYTNLEKDYPAVYDGLVLARNIIQEILNFKLDLVIDFEHKNFQSIREKSAFGSLFLGMIRELYDLVFFTSESRNYFRNIYPNTAYLFRYDLSKQIKEVYGIETKFEKARFSGKKRIILDGRINYNELMAYIKREELKKEDLPEIIYYNDLNSLLKGEGIEFYPLEKINRKKISKADISYKEVLQKLDYFKNNLEHFYESEEYIIYFRASLVLMLKTGEKQNLNTILSIAKLLGKSFIKDAELLLLDLSIKKLFKRLKYFDIKKEKFTDLVKEYIFYKDNLDFYNKSSFIYSLILNEFSKLYQALYNNLLNIEKIIIDEKAGASYLILDLIELSKTKIAFAEKINREKLDYLLKSGDFN